MDIELRIPQTMKLFGSTKKLINKAKNGGKVPSLERVEVVLVQFNLVDNRYQQKSEVLHTFTLNKSYAYLLMEMTCYSIKPRTRKYVNGYRFLSFARNLSNKYGKQLLHTVAKTGLDALKTSSKKVVHKTPEETGKLIENMIRLGNLMKIQEVLKK